MQPGSQSSSVSGLSPLPRRDNKDGLIPISWTSTRHDSCRPPSTAHDGYTAGASYRNEWSESDHHQECRGRFGRKGTARHRAAHFEHVGTTLSIASVVSILKVAIVVPPFEPRLQQIYADSSRETVQHQQQQAKHRLRPLSVCAIADGSLRHTLRDVSVVHRCAHVGHCMITRGPSFRSRYCQ